MIPVKDVMVRERNVAGDSPSRLINETINNEEEGEMNLEEAKNFIDMMIIRRWTVGLLDVNTPVDVVENFVNPEVAKNTLDLLYADCLADKEAALSEVTEKYNSAMELYDTEKTEHDRTKSDLATLETVLKEKERQNLLLLDCIAKDEKESECLHEQIAALTHKVKVAEDIQHAEKQILLQEIEKNTVLTTERNEFQAMLVADEPPYYTKWKDLTAENERLRIQNDDLCRQLNKREKDEKNAIQERLIAIFQEDLKDAKEEGKGDITRISYLNECLERVDPGGKDALADAVKMFDAKEAEDEPKCLCKIDKAICPVHPAT